MGIASMLPIICFEGDLTRDLRSRQAAAHSKQGSNPEHPHKVMGAWLDTGARKSRNVRGQPRLLRTESKAGGAQVVACFEGQTRMLRDVPPAFEGECSPQGAGTVDQSRSAADPLNDTNWVP